MNGDIQSSIDDLLRPRVIVCAAAAYSDGTEHCLDLATARTIIRITRTNACVINTPRRLEKVPEASLLVSDLIDAFADPFHVVPFLNTSRATSSAQAQEMIECALPTLDELGAEFHRASLFKLEVLDRELRVLDDETLQCLRRLETSVRQRTIPILTPDPGVIGEAIILGCPAVRLLSGRIGQQTGILDRSAVSDAICRAQGRPVILEGGIDTAEHIYDSAGLGAVGVLMNSAFRLASDPIARATEIRKAADDAW